MRIVKKGLKEEQKRILFQAILDRGELPKSEKKLATPRFLLEYIQYLNALCATGVYTVSVENLFRDFGGAFVINGSNIKDVRRYPVIIQYCRVSDVMSVTDWGKAIMLNIDPVEYSKELLTNAIVSKTVTDSQLTTIACAVGHTLAPDIFKPMKSAYVKDLFYRIKSGKISYNHTVRARAALAIFYIHDTAGQVDREEFADLLNQYIYNDAEPGDYAPVLQVYINPMRFDDYYSIVIKNHLEPDYAEMDDYLSTCDRVAKLHLLEELCSSNGNNLRFAKTKEEIHRGMVSLSKDHPITDYGVFKKIYANGCLGTIVNSFIEVGNLSTISSDDIPSIFSENQKVQIVAHRPDAVKQFVALLRKPNGMIYLSSAIQYLNQEDLIVLMDAYVEYMETLDNQKRDGVSMDIYMASYIKKEVPVSAMIKWCPKMLRYVETVITDYPDEFDSLQEWISVAESTPIINLTDGGLYQKIKRANQYIPFNYHHIVFSVEQFGIEEVLDESVELVKLITDHPGYYFDISSPDVRKIIMEYLVEKSVKK